MKIVTVVGARPQFIKMSDRLKFLDIWWNNREIPTTKQDYSKPTR